MDQETRLKQALEALRGSPARELPDGFMDGVWARAGQLGEAADARRRMALFAVIFAIGMGAGFGTIHLPADRAGGSSYEVFAGDNLSPAALLHVQS
jgi:hypothetical protein